MWRFDASPPNRHEEPGAPRDFTGNDALAEWARVLHRKRFDVMTRQNAIAAALALGFGLESAEGALASDIERSDGSLAFHGGFDEACSSRPSSSASASARAALHLAQ